ncbi:hypothetical protein CALCODRAFT_372260 [Calocera cornea HHB12733]|uniref:Uncharacterized protein n=1 Tax=Calocera cornea HHB12733 TaxID=1353952 RepID=A0A165EGR4_9BASI|nr:hypothetical protein CALCODRAFT_372260 [Calocera cornea HHB12733]
MVGPPRETFASVIWSVVSVVPRPSNDRLRAAALHCTEGAGEAREECLIHPAVSRNSDGGSHATQAKQGMISPLVDPAPPPPPSLPRNTLRLPQPSPARSFPKPGSGP